MAYVADLHLHSRFSRACSKDINVPNLAKWAKFKGINLVGTSDFLHPVWRTELKSVLKRSSSGLYEYEGVKFLPSCEISCIYSHLGKVRRIHLVVLLPSLESVDKLAVELAKRKVNLASDGRPITGISSHELAEIILTVENRAIIIPAHIWTPYFGLFGSMSGYDFLEECFEDLSKDILAVETGLSSDPVMNWRVANLDQKTIVSFSDAHSVPNLGREATIFAGPLTYGDLYNDLKNQNLLGTIEFFPEEGKYHYSGHQACQVVYSPLDVKEKGEICPVCGKKLVIGVMQRVEELATRSPDDLKLENVEGMIKSKALPQRPGFKMLVGLEKIIAEALSSTTSSQKVKNEYDKLISNLGSELMILTKASLEQIKGFAGPKISEGIGLVREGKLVIEPGYDNKYGVIKVWGNLEENSQMELF